MSYASVSALARRAEGLAIELERLKHDPPAAEELSQRLDALRSELDRVLQLAQSSELRYRSVLDAAPDAITVHDELGRILEANRRACEMFGFEPDEFRALSVYDINPDLPLDHMARLVRTMRPGQTEQVETSNRTRDGQRFPVEVRSSLFSEDGKMRVVALARDLTQRRASEQELRDAETRYRTLLTVIDKGVLVQDRTLAVLSANDAARRILDLPAGDPAALSAAFGQWQWLDEHARPIRADRGPQRLALDQARAAESRVFGLFNNATLRLIWISLTVQPQFQGAAAEPFQVISLFSDVTELKRASELFDEAQRLARAGGFEVDVPNGQLYVTDELYRIFGRDPSRQLTIQELPELIHPADRERVVNLVQRLNRDDRALDFEVRILTGNLESGWIRVLSRSHSRNGQLLRISGVVQEITAAKIEEDRLKKQAQQDGLTGLANRDTFLTALKRAISAADVGHGPAVLYVDLDRFKVLNDLLGHAAGDRLLAAAAQRLQQAAPGSSLVARIGADEFAVLVPEVVSDDLLWRVAERIGRAFSRPFEHNGEEFLITASLGLARFPEDGGNAEQLLHHADAAMFEAKRRGRNNWQSFSPALAAQLKERLLIETQLRRALEGGELRVVYQPKVHLHSGRVIGGEALLRWRNRSLGELPPDIFVPHAETTGDIVRIGAFVVRESCRQLARWRRAGLKLDHIAVNVSFRQILSDRFERDVADALLDEGLDGSSLELELTERVLIEDSPEVRSTIESLRKMGVRLCIDDFGEGYSALGYLRRLPIQSLKISHHFMQGIPVSQTDTRLCEVIVQMARALNLKVVAEGVETEAQSQLLIQQGVEFAQGYLYAKPLESEDFEAFVRANQR